MLPNIASFDTYSSSILEDYSPVEDPSTDLSADGMNQLIIDTAMMTGTALRARLQFSYDAESASVILIKHRALWGAASIIAPVVSRTSSGIFTITFPTSITDDLGTAINILLNQGLAQIFDNNHAQFYSAQVQITSANTALLYVRDYLNALSDAAGNPIDVFLF